MDLGLRDRTALVCASTTGLGLAVARELAAEGARVVITGRRGEVARTEAKKLRGALGLQVDLSVAGAVSSLIQSLRGVAGHVDILVLNTGGPLPGLAQALTREDAQTAVDAMLMPMIELVHGLLPMMIERGWGRILAIGSSGVQQPIPGLVLSNTVRAALAGYLKTLAEEVARHGVAVNMLLPGRVATARVSELDAAKAKREGRAISEVIAEAHARIPAGRYGAPEEFARVASFLCSDAASYIIGEQVRVDGGLVGGY